MTAYGWRRNERVREWDHKTGRRGPGEVLARSRRSGGCSARGGGPGCGEEGRAGWGGGGPGCGEEGRGSAGAGDAHRGHWSQERAHATHAGPRSHATRLRPAPGSPFRLLPPLAGPAPPRPEDAAGFRAGGGRRSARSGTAPTAGSPAECQARSLLGALGCGPAAPAPSWVPARLRNEPRGIAFRFLACAPRPHPHPTRGRGSRCPLGAVCSCRVWQGFQESGAGTPRELVGKIPAARPAHHTLWGAQVSLNAHPAVSYFVLSGAYYSECLKNCNRPCPRPPRLPQLAGHLPFPSIKPDKAGSLFFL